MSAFSDDAQAFCTHFLETEPSPSPRAWTSATTAQQHVRIAYTQALPRLQEAVARIARGLERWRG